jgi:dTDP-4-amino-4,6-dideoxygalactose transaminase
VDKYTWRKIGSSFLPGELTAAFLYAQLEEEKLITAKRLKMWDFYHMNLKNLEAQSRIRRPHIPNDCEHNAHMYYVVLNNVKHRNKVLEFLQKNGVGAVFHYVPLHSSPAGSELGRVAGNSLPNTDSCASGLIRLPLWIGLTEEQQSRIINILTDAFISLE